MRFKETTVTTKHLAEGIAADYNSDGLLAGIEIPDAVKRLRDPMVFRQVILEHIAIGRKSLPAAQISSQVNGPRQGLNKRPARIAPR
jgi:uncharacterized protein YuzE